MATSTPFVKTGMASPSQDKAYSANSTLQTTPPATTEANLTTEKDSANGNCNQKNIQKQKIAATSNPTLGPYPGLTSLVMETYKHYRRTHAHPVFPYTERKDVNDFLKKRRKQIEQYTLERQRAHEKELCMPNFSPSNLPQRQQRRRQGEFETERFLKTWPDAFERIVDHVLSREYNMQELKNARERLRQIAISKECNRILKKLEDYMLSEQFTALSRTERLYFSYRVHELAIDGLWKQCPEVRLEKLKRLVSESFEYERILKQTIRQSKKETNEPGLETQMFSLRSMGLPVDDIKEAVQSAKTSAEDFSMTNAMAQNSMARTTKAIEQAMASATQLMDKLPMLLAGVAKKTQKTLTMIIRYLVKFVTFSAFVWRRQQDLTAFDWMLLVVSTWTAELETLGTMAVQSLKKACEVIAQSWFSKAPMQTQGAGDGQHHETIVGAFCNVLKNLAGREGFEEARGFNISLKKVQALSVLVRSAETIGHYTLIIGEKLMEWFTTYVLKRGTTVPRLLQNGPLVRLVERWNEIEKSGDLKRITVNRQVISAAMSIEKELLDIERKIFDTGMDLYKATLLSYTRMLRMVVQSHTGKIPEAMKTVEVKTRPRSLWINVVGPPRIGKTTFVQKWILTGLMAKLFPDVKFESTTNLTYTRNPSTPYWEGYYEQYITNYDDLFQVFADEQSMYSTIQELTSITNDGPVPLDMAFGGKGNTFFNSPIIYSSSNSDFKTLPAVGAKCVSGGEHLVKRRDFVVTITAKEKYMKADGSGIDTESFPQAYDPEDPYTAIPEDLYKVKITDGTGEEEYIEGTFRVAMEHLFARAKALNDSRMGVNNTLEDVLEQFHKNTATGAVPRPRVSGHDEHLGAPDEYVSSTSFRMIRPRDRKHRHTQYRPEASNVAVQTPRTASGIPVALTAFRRTVSPVVEQSSLVDSGLQTEMLSASNYDLDPYKHDVDQIAKDEYAALDLYMDSIPNPTDKDNEDYLRNSRFIAERLAQRQMARIELDARICRHENRRRQWTVPAPRPPPPPPLRDEWSLEDSDEETKEEVDLTKYQQTWWQRAKQRIATFFGQPGPEPCLKHIVQDVGLKVSRALRPQETKTDAEQILEDIQFKFLKHPLTVTARIVIGITAILAATYAGIKLYLATRPMKTQEYNPQNENVNGAINTHVTSWRFMETGKETPITAIGSLNVGHSIFALPRHFCERTVAFQKEHPDMPMHFELEIKTRGRIVVPLENVEFMFRDKRDIAFARIKNLASTKELIHLFMRVDDQPDLGGCYLYGHRSLVYGSNQGSSLLTVTNVKVQKNLRYKSNPVSYAGFPVPEQDYCSLHGYMYNGVTTVGGDCGMILCHADNKYNQKILGMHTAGAAGTGYSERITMEDIQAAYDHFGTQPKKSTEVVTTPEISMLERRAPEITEKLNVVGKAATMQTQTSPVLIRQHPQNRTKYHKSHFADAMDADLGPSPNAPAALGPFYNEQTERIEFPLAKGILKLANSGNHFPVQLLEEATTHALDSLNSLFETSPHERVVLDWHSAVNGYRKMRQIEVTTSAGLPYTVVNPSNGKKPWMTVTHDESGRLIYTPTSDLQAALELREQKALCGEETTTIFVATTKDETRPHQKVVEGRTRVFQVGPMDLSLLLRKYCGAFISDCQSHPVRSEIAVGINPYSPAWDLLFKRLETNGDHFICGDYKDFDATLSYQLGMAVCSLVNQYYADSPTSQKLRETLFSQMFSSVQVAQDTVFECWQGNPSGDAMTTIINCLANMILMRMAFREITRMGMEEYTSNVQASFYGDDHIISVSDHAAACGFDMIALSHFFQKYGMKYTSANKEAIEVPYSARKDLSYLKNEFVWSSELGLVVAQPPFNEVFDLLYWIRTPSDNVTHMTARVNSALQQLVGYGRSAFNAARKMCIRWSQQAYDQHGLKLDHSQFFTFERCVKQQYEMDIATTSTTTMVDDRVAASTVKLLAQASHKGKERTHRGRNVHTVANARTVRFLRAMETHMFNGEALQDDFMEVEEPFQWLPPSPDSGYGEGDTELVTVYNRDLHPVNAAQALPYDTREIIYENGEPLDPLQYDYFLYEYPNTYLSTHCALWNADDIELPACPRTDAIYIARHVAYVLRTLEEWEDDARHRLIELVEDYDFVSFFLTMGDISRFHWNEINEFLNTYTSFYHAKIMVQTDPDYYWQVNAFENRWGPFTLYPVDTPIDAPYLVAQMDGQKKTEGTTTHLDAVVTHNPGEDHGQRHLMPTAQKHFSTESNFNRPIVVLNTSWTAAQAEGTLLATINLPHDWADTFIQTKLAYWAFFRAGFKLRFVLNGTRQHYGRLLVSWLPNPEMISAIYKNYMCMWTADWYQIDAGANQPVEIEIPYTHYLENIPATQVASTTYLSLYIHVAVPLQMVDGVAAPLSLTVFAEPLNMSLHGWSLQTPSLFTQMLGDVEMQEFAGANVDAREYQPDDEALRSEKAQYLQNEAEVETNSRTTTKSSASRFLKTAGRAMTMFSLIPGVGALAAVAGYATMAAGSLASWFGFAVPPNVETTHPMQIRQPRYYSSEDTPLTQIAAHRHNAMMHPDYSLVNDTPKVNSLLYYMQRPARLHQSQWTTVNVPGDYLEQIFLNPLTMVRNTSVAGTVSDTPLSRMCAMAAYWRGSIQLHFVLIASKFHSGRLRIVYDPLKFASDTRTVYETTHLVNMVWDINEQTEVSVCVPYDHLTAHKRLRRSSDESSSLGCVSVQVTNSLTSSAAVTNPVYLQVFVSAGADFQISLPTQQPLGNYIPTLMTQMGGQGFNAKSACEFPSSSMKCLREQQYQMLGEGPQYLVNSYAQSTLMHTVRDLTNMTSYFQSFSFSTATTEIEVRPYGVVQKNGTTSDSFIDFVRTMFLYWRGGMRVCVTGQAGFQSSMDIIDDTADTADSNPTILQTPIATTPNALIWGKTWFQPLPNSSTTPADFIVPYFSRTKCLPNKNFTDPGSVLPGSLRGRLLVSSDNLTMTSATSTNLSIFVGGGDDFILGFQLPCPLMVAPV